MRIRGCASGDDEEASGGDEVPERVLDAEAEVVDMEEDFEKGKVVRAECTIYFGQDLLSDIPVGITDIRLRGIDIIPYPSRYQPTRFK